MDKKKVKKTIRKIVNRYDFRLLKKEIESYGYSYSFKNYIFSLLICILIIVCISIYIELKAVYILILGITILLVIPFIIQSQFRQLYEIKRFEMVCNYLDNVIPIFKRTPLIVQTWREVLDLVDGEMKYAIEEALDLVMTNTEDPYVKKSAFQIIESHFSNSRIHSVHQMMYTVETQNTKNYILSIDNIWIDVQSWISRVNIFHKNLNERKVKLTLLSLLTMASNCLFVSMYSSNDIFKNFTDNTVYQVSSTFFMILLIITLTLFQIKLTGKWLLDDNSEKMKDKAIKSFEYIREKKLNRDVNIINKIIAGLLALLGAMVWIVSKNILFSLLCIYSGYMIYSQNKRIYKSHFKNLKKYLQIEFPLWMRDVSLNLQNLTVVNAIESTKTGASIIFSYYIEQFLDEFYQNPHSIKPFNCFLESFHIDGVKSSMKSLYSLQSLSKEEMIKQTSYLIVRNQEMLAESENIKNEDSINSLKLLGFLPVGIFILQMLVSMGLLFSVMIELMNYNSIF